MIAWTVGYPVWVTPVPTGMYHIITVMNAVKKHTFTSSSVNSFAQTALSAGYERWVNKMSYSRVSTPPCKGCENRHAKCHAKCAEYSEWSKQRQEEKEKAYKKYKDENIADEYFYDGLYKNVTRCRKEGRSGHRKYY